MNPPNGDYGYGLPAGPRAGPRPPPGGGPGYDPRMNAQPGGPAMRPGAGAAPIESNQSRAARYEDEKRRIIESCFARKEQDGSLTESYITHVRITEDAMYPSTPPPPDSAPNNKKSRLILVSVRKSGRVKVHKARENPSGSFSIGKTWALDDLTAIQIFAAYQPTNEREHMEKQWASDMGFTVTLGKPYYWHAPTAKEKDFFIASLLKIYKKYTGGKTPDLIGFLPHQIDQLGAQQPQQQQANRTPSGSVSQTPPPLFHTPPPPVPAASQRPHSPAMPRTSPGPPARFDQQQGLPPRADLRGTPTSPMPDPLRSPARPDRRMPSRENMRKSPDMLPSASASADLPPTMPPMPRQLLGQRPPGPPDAHLRGGIGLSSPASQSSLASRDRPPIPPQASQTSLESREKQGFPPTGKTLNGAFQPQRPFQDKANASSEFLSTANAIRNRSVSSAQSSDRPTTATSDATSSTSKLPTADSLPPPDRKRPPLPRDDTSAAPSADSSAFVTPATTPSARKDEVSEKSASTVETPKDSKSEQGVKADYFATAPVLTPKSPERKVTQDKPGTSVENTTPTDITNGAQTAEPDEIASPDKSEASPKSAMSSMLKKKNAADTFRKAAFAVNAFKPRQGGGAARLKAMQEEGKKGGEPDGITGVVPAPLFRGMSSDSVSSARPTTPLTPAIKDPPLTPQPGAVAPRVNLQRTATEDSVATQQSQQTQQSQKSQQSGKDKQLLDSPALDEPKAKPVQQPVRPPTPEKARSRSPQRRKRQRQEQDIAKYCSSLAIDPRIFEGRGADFSDLLSEFGWDGKLDPKRKIDDLETVVRREIGRAQATGWLGHVEQQDTKVQELARAFDRAIEECEELDGLFTLYSHELDTLAADIEYIEAQSQGLQVQTANQKLLQKELQGLLSTLRISQADLRDLHYAPLDNAQGVTSVEQALVTLYHALITIDPNIRQNRQRREGQGSNADRGIGVYADAELGQMRAVREKKDEYGEQSNAFIQRFCQHMNGVFKTLENSRDDDTGLKSVNSDSSSSLSTQRTARQDLWLYNGMMLFVREVNSYEWKTLIKSYEMNIRGSYQEQFRQVAMSSRRDARRPTGDEEMSLFTYQEKEKSDESLTSTAARKLTVKRGKTVKTSGLKPSLSSRNQDGKPDAYEVFQSVLEQQASVVAEEQNFMVTYFHLSSHSNVDFSELVLSKPPQERRLPNLSNKIAFEPDKSISGTIQASIEAIYSFWLGDLQGQLEWVLKQDQLQGVGVLCALEHVLTIYDDTNQEFITTTVRALHTRLTGLFHKFVDEQIKAIEETKVKLKKRKGIISFMRTFPLFSTSVENMIPEQMVANENLEVRFILNDAYTKVLRAMWESLTFIAKDDSTTGTAGHSAAPNTGDPEDKEALNYHILLIENMNHYIEEVDTHHNIVLDEWKEKATNDMFTHLTQYTDAVIRRPLGKWLDFVESTEAMMKTAESYQSLASKPSHSRSTCKKIIKSYDAAEVRKGIDTLKKRVEKHFGDVDDPNTMSKSLVSRVLEECSARYAHAHDRMKNIIDKVYDGSLEIDWRKEDVTSMFKR